MNPEEKLRARIRNILSVAGANRSQALSAKEVEDGIMELFREYGHSPKDARDSAYEKGKRKVLKTLHLQSLESSK